MGLGPKSGKAPHPLLKTAFSINRQHPGIPENLEEFHTIFTTQLAVLHVSQNIQKNAISVLSGHQDV